MIDCPICHVKNHDDARFCAECGQRLGAAATGPASSEQGPPRQQPTQADPPAPARQKLHSPLLNDSADEYLQGESSNNFGGQAQNTNEVNRLRQMSGRQQDPPPANQVNPDRPYKNPFDPRNANTEGSAPQHNPEQPRKLRSPLLSGDEFVDDNPEQGQAPPPQRGGNLRSPLLGGGETSSSGFRSQYDDSDEAPQSGQLRSPLLGGGGSSQGGYPGGERRKANPPDSSYGANERRRGGLRSPMLGGGEADYDDYDQAEDDEPLDEDNPNVLRSPLLAARRPMNDRQRKEPAPINSNTQNPPRAGQMPDVGPNLQSPSSSYTSLKSIQPQGQPAAPQAVPPVPADTPPLSARPEQTGLPTGYAGYQEPARAAQPPIAPQGPPTNVPPSFITGFGGASSPGANPSVPSAQPIRPPEPEANTTTSSTRGINVQPPTPSRSLPSYKSQDSGAGADEPIKTKGRSKILSSGYEGQDDTDDYVPATADRYAVAPRPGSPIPKIIGVVAVLLLLMKAWAFKDFVSTDWGKIAWLVTDQFVTMGIIICLAVLAFTRKD